LNDLLVVQSVRFLSQGGEFIRTKNHLGETLAVSQVDENDTTMVAPGSNPSSQGNFLSNLFGAEFVAVMCAIHARILEKQKPLQMRETRPR
jgi:hypothetical protein